jgi:hypothetical protein
MDRNNFRKISNPNFYANYKNENVNLQKFNMKTMENAPDNRYEEWPAVMSDGRLATDYTNHCSKNIPAGKQFPTKVWLQNNGEKVINFSRSHQFPVTKPLDSSVVPPPAQILTTTKHDSQLTSTHNNLGIGVERANNQTPELFGTFAHTTFQDKPQSSKKTSYFEGGRNTPRGTYSNIESIYHLNKREDY